MSTLAVKSSIEVVSQPKTRAILLADGGLIPNNPSLPLLLYHQVLHLPDERAAFGIERLLKDHDWYRAWRNGIFPFHHYHSTAQEVLVVYGGSATVQFGGESAAITEYLEKGDAVVIPAGVGHKNLGATDDFAVLGAYAGGRNWNLCYGTPDERPRVDHEIAQVPVPRQDPFYGPRGPLSTYWTS